MNFYQPSEGSSENLKAQSLENDKEDAGEIIYQQKPTSKSSRERIEDKPQHPGEGGSLKRLGTGYGNDRSNMSG